MLERVTLVLLLSVPTSYGQHVLYNQGQDKTAQDAEAAAKEITTGITFDTMLQNLDVQAKHEADTILAFSREQMRSKIASARVWNRDNEDPNPLNFKGCSSVHCTLERVRFGLQRDIPTETVSQTKVQERLRDLHKKAEELRSHVKELQDSAQAKSDPFIIRTLDHLGDVKDVIGFAEQISQPVKVNQGTLNSLDKISSGLDEMIALYASLKGIWTASMQVNVKIGDLAPRPESIQLQLLALEEQHLKKLTEIRAKRELQAGEVLVSIDMAESLLKGQDLWESKATIEDTLAADVKSPEKLRQVVGALYLFAAAAAAEDTATRLAAVRESDEEQRYSIRKSAVNASTYDITIQAAVQRLAVYYKSGIKPSELAALIFYLTNSVAVPTIAAK